MASSRRRMKLGTVFERRSVHYMMFIFLFSAFLFLCSSARDTRTIHSWVVPEDTLVSAGGRFVLGFFSRGSSVRYVGIWYKSDPSTVVWVANRGNPLPIDAGAVIVIENGNLNVYEANRTFYRSTGLKSSVPTNITAKLLDSGNLVLSEFKEGKEIILWQSFEHPTDTFLPGMVMDKSLQLVSWKDKDDPTVGDLTFKMDEENGYVIQKETKPYWMSKGFYPPDDLILPAVNYLLSNFSEALRKRNFPLANPTISPGNQPNDHISPSEYANTRMVMNRSEIQYWNWSWDDNSNWTLIWSEPNDCSVLNFCGSFGICNLNRYPRCSCLPGFRPVSPQGWQVGDFSDGCKAKSKSKSCEKYRFLNYTQVRVGKPELQFNVIDEIECRKKCKCQCRAYSYGSKQRPSSGISGMCWIWRNALTNLQEDYIEEDYIDGSHLSVNVAIPDNELTSRNCEICGRMIVPYPLSTRPNCGDPMYYSFQCNGSTSQLSFNTSSIMSQVVSIDSDTLKFTILSNTSDGCSADTIKQLRQSLSSPFNLTKTQEAGSSEKICLFEIGWDPPPEPTCTSSIDCKDWPSSSCSAAGNGNRRCLCNTNFRWDPSTLNCTDSSLVAVSGTSEQKILIVLISVISVSALSCVAIVYIWRKYVIKSEDVASQRNRVVRRFNTERHAKDLIETSEFNEEDKKGIDVPFFEFESILTATDDFSNANKLGQGGYGPVYKGMFPGGQELAVKRLSSVSGQGLQEFKNEVVLIAKLQHRNLVKLWGYCVKGDEKILIYEYMPNRSLDAFIFDSKLAASLDWEMRYNIILGIARGLLYLHQDSRLRIIHRDMKTSNILLDGEMNPKISDFGLARIFGGKQNEANTNRVVGTYGYMAPEYALDGFFSVKSDVFSFGVVMLEIISGKRNTGFYRSQETLSLLGTAWQFWEEDDALKLMDQTLEQSCNRSEFVKCVHVGLLCVQEEANDRPDMATVMVMLGSESANLPSPKQPAFIARAGPSSSGIASSSNGSKTGTWSDLTNTYVEGR